MPALISSLYSWWCNKAIQHTAKVFCDMLSSPANFWKVVWWEGRIHKLILLSCFQRSVPAHSGVTRLQPWFQSCWFFASFSRLSDDLLSKWGNPDQMLNFNKPTEEPAAPLLLSLYLRQLNIRMKRLLSLHTTTFILSFLCCKFLP